MWRCVGWGGGGVGDDALTRGLAALFCVICTALPDEQRRQAYPSQRHKGQRGGSIRTWLSQRADLLCCTD